VKQTMQIVVVGGGAAGFFAALAAKKACPEASVTLLEKTAKLLSKVRVSGGGRCNVTHHCFDPKELVKNYPRGAKELIGPLHRFGPSDTVEWFESRGVRLKNEEDGRMFPVTNSSSTIINCLRDEAEKLQVEVLTQKRLVAIEKKGVRFTLTEAAGGELEADRLLLATGSSKQGHAFASALGHAIEPLVPSLFTFNVPGFELKELSGVSLSAAGVSLKGTKLKQVGALLITHWGFSGPAALKLSAWGARYLSEQNYRVGLVLDWLPDLDQEQLAQLLAKQKESVPRQSLGTRCPVNLPRKLWNKLLHRFGVDATKRWADLGKKEVRAISGNLKSDGYPVSGKTTNKDEFVTCGGVARSEVNFKNMESKLCPGLFFAGEILDIDGVTGGFNFQNAWTTGWIAGTAMGKKTEV
jgi:predicted Rossmann fold flavoprotein